LIDTNSEGSPVTHQSVVVLQDNINCQITQPESHATAALQRALPEDIHQPIQMVGPNLPKTRKSQKRLTPVVEDEVRRSSRLHKLPGFEHMELDEKSKPRKLAKETLLQGQLQIAMAEFVSEDQMLLHAEFGNQFL